MKLKFITFLSLVSIVFISCVTMGNGNIITDERILSSFEKIEISGYSEVRFHSSTEYRAIVTIDSNLNEYFETIIINDILKIRPKIEGKYIFTKNIVDVYCPTISDISISGSGKFEMIDKIIVPTFQTNISGSGKINGTIECNNFFAHISGSGDINISGNSEDVDIDISGSGNFDGSEFKIKNCSIKISGSGEATIFVEDSLNAKISGSGHINYRGNPKIDFRGSGSGRMVGIE